LIIIDLIDMESAGNRDKVYRALGEALRADKARTNILKISELGLVEMTRKRTRENLVQTLCEPCGYCEGRGYILSSESVGFRILREIRKHLPKLMGRPVAVAVNPRVAEELLTGSKQALAILSEEIGRDIEVRARPGIHQERFELIVLEQGEPVELELAWLRDRHPDAQDENAEPAKRNGRRRGRGGRGRASSELLIAEGEIDPPSSGAETVQEDESVSCSRSPFRPSATRRRAIPSSLRTDPQAPTASRRKPASRPNPNPAQIPSRNPREQRKQLTLKRNHA
jgi:hypothetical protein